MAVDYAFYRDEYRGALPADSFAEVLPLASSHVAWLCARSPQFEDSAFYGRAVCAAADAFAEFGDGPAGGVTLGSYKVSAREGEGLTGADMATRAALRELGLSGAAFSGAGR